MSLQILNERRKKINELAEACVKKQIGKDSGLSPDNYEELLDEVTSLVEWPVALCGKFDAEFLSCTARSLNFCYARSSALFPSIERGRKITATLCHHQ